jgi:chromosome segregation protein
VHLKSLTLRGFKSFASTTTLRFEPGVTAVVGPNGSGKSNVVDAIAWVLGEQGAKSLRGGKMEDVIFAGTPSRPPLGRAEVVLTIDNADAALPIDYSEVTISRLMYRSGTSEYAINGSSCRLLDVQELLSDSGIGRELHVIVGQGQLDAVLSARPEDRRAFLEEAAGVLKHRRRKEKALRKLDAMAANLTRLNDLTGELRRQLGPLGRQAEVARRAASIQADLRDARLRMLAEDLARLRGSLAEDVAAETAARERRSEAEARLSAAVAAETRLENAAEEEAPRLAAAAQTWYLLAGLAEQIRGTGRLAAERASHLGGEPEQLRFHADPDELESQARAAREEEQRIVVQLGQDRQRLAAAVTVREEAEARLTAAEQALVSAVRAVADRREGLARLAGDVSAAQTRRVAAEEEAGRLAAAAAAASARRRQAEVDFAALELEVAGLDSGEVGLDAEHAGASATLAAAEERVAALAEQERVIERDRAGLTARQEALSLVLDCEDGAATLLAAADETADPAGVLGPVSALIEVEPGYGTAVAAALGAAADGVAVANRAAALEALRRVRAEDAGRVTLVLADAPQPVGGHAPLPEPARWAEELVSSPNEVIMAPLQRLLDGVAVVEDVSAAMTLLPGRPELTVVTRAGEVLTSASATGGSAAARTQLETREALTEVAAALDALHHRAERQRFAVAAAAGQRSSAADAVTQALARLHDSDARLAALAERLGHLGAAALAAAAEADRLTEAGAAATAARDVADAILADRGSRLTAAQAAPQGGEPDRRERDERAGAVGEARQGEVEVRLAVRTGEERLRGVAGRAQSLQAAAAAERRAREQAARARELRIRRAARAGAVATAAGTLLATVEAAQRAAGAERQTAESARTERDRELSAVRSSVRTLTGEVEALTDAVHRDEVARAELRLRIEAVERRASEEYAVSPAVLVPEFGPQVAVAPADGGQPRPYDRAEQEKRAAGAERALARLGRVNPLALEEYAALEERHAFLVAQLGDLQATRRDLLTVVREVDERVEEVFAAAFADTAREFEAVFAALFPGGSGRLSLTDPSDVLTTGIEVEARPAGKKVSRLSLLSGGERSLTAIAMLVAIFRARPSPFYVLDEVEAALDDRNLGRLLALLADLRGASQLLVITHQKRTMEVADALYGVTMSGEGVTTVISQRLREPVTASA